MIKNNAIKRILISSLALFVLIFLYLFPVNNFNKINSSITYIEAVKTPIYLIDENNYVSRINILKKENDINKEIPYLVETLTKKSSYSEYIPVGFYGVIPENTKLIDFSLNDGLLKLNFSEEFLNSTKEEEIQIIESLVFSLCEFKEINELMIFINDEKLIKLPQNNITLPNTIDKQFGINKVYDITNFKNTTQTINYYIAKNNEYTYYIPISKFENSNYEKVEIIIKNLQTSLVNQTNLISYLKVSATLESYEILEETINISFNNEIIADLSSDEIIEEVKYSIFLSLRDTYDIKSVIFDIPSEKNVSVLLD